MRRRSRRVNAPPEPPEHLLIFHGKSYRTEASYMHAFEAWEAEQRAWAIAAGYVDYIDPNDDMEITAEVAAFGVVVQADCPCPWDGTGY